MIIIDVETTNDAVKLTSANLSNIGEIISLEHFRNVKKIGYQTIIVGSDHTLRVDGGLGSGYPGEGPRGLENILGKLGLDKNTAQSLVYDKNATHFKYEFKKSI